MLKRDMVQRELLNKQNIRGEQEIHSRVHFNVIQYLLERKGEREGIHIPLILLIYISGFCSFDVSLECIRNVFFFFCFPKKNLIPLRDSVVHLFIQKDKKRLKKLLHVSPARDYSLFLFLFWLQKLIVGQTHVFTNPRGWSSDYYIDKSSEG